MSALNFGPLRISTIPYLICLLLCFLLALNFIPGRKRPEVRVFLWLILCESAWIVGFILELLAQDIQGKLFWDSVQFAPSLACTVFLLGFARLYTGCPKAFKPLELTALLVIIAAISVLSFTDGLHGLVRASPYLDSSVVQGELAYDFTFLDWLIFTLFYAISLWSLFLLLRKGARSHAASRIKHTLVAIGFMFPVLGILGSMLGLRILGHRDFSAFTLVLANICIAFALFRYRLFNLLPLARRLIVESLHDPVMVIDTDGVLVDCNRAMGALLKIRRGRLRGSAVSSVFSSWPSDAKEILQECSGECRISLGSSPGQQHFMLDCATLEKSDGTPGQEAAVLGKVVVLRDISDIVEAERSLHTWNDALESRIHERTEALEAEVLKSRQAEAKLRSAGQNIHGTQREIMLTLAELVESRSKETANHVLRVAEYARIMSEVRGLAPEEVSLVADAAPMHDLGKIVVPDGILNKPGSLSADEMELMRTHTTVGYEILSKSERSLIKTAALIALEHHEHWDGGGYPQGMVGTTISLAGRIVCVCDVFDALAMTRIYKDAWELPRIYEFFRDQKGRMFDPELVDLLFLNLDRFLAVAAKYPEVPLDARIHEGTGA